MSTKVITEVDENLSVKSTDKFLINDNGDLRQIAIALLQEFIGDGYVPTTREILGNSLDTDIYLSDLMVPMNRGSGTTRFLLESEINTLLESYVANTDYASNDNAGIVQIAFGGGLNVSSTGGISIKRATASDIKNGTNQYVPITPIVAKESAFYGLAKSAGDTTQTSSSNPVGTYTSEAKRKIRNMIGADGGTWEVLLDKTLNANSTTPLDFSDVNFNGEFKKIMIQIRGTMDVANSNIFFYRANLSTAYGIFANVGKTAETIYEFIVEGKPFLRMDSIRDSTATFKSILASNNLVQNQGAIPIASLMSNITELKVSTGGSSANFLTGTRVVVWGLK